MPKFMESKLKKEYPGDNSAVYGTMNKLGFMKGNKETPLGAAAQKKHDAKKPKSSGLAKLGKKDADGDYD